jgi:hypothetical protein
MIAMENNSEKNTKTSGGSTPETKTSSYGNAYQQLNQKEVRFSFDLTLGDYFRIPDSFKYKTLASD